MSKCILMCHLFQTLATQRIFITNHVKHCDLLFIRCYYYYYYLIATLQNILICYFKIKIIHMKLKIAFITHSEIDFSICQLPDNEVAAVTLFQNFGIIHEKKVLFKKLKNKIMNKFSYNNFTVNHIILLSLTLDAIYYSTCVISQVVSFCPSLSQLVD